MEMTDNIYVRAIDGTPCLIPLRAQKLHDNEYLILDTIECNPDDTSLLFEFLPGDTVKTENKNIENQGNVTIAVAMLKTIVPNRKYWEILYRTVTNKQVSQTEIDHSYQVAMQQIVQEVNQCSRYHYPEVVKLVNNYAK